MKCQQNLDEITKINPVKTQVKTMPFNFLLNDDIFISYSRKDSGTYVAGLADELTKKGFSCFTDQRGTDANRVTPESLFNKIKNCKLLVLLGSEGAALSEPVALEVKKFAEANGTSRIIPISFDKDAKDAEWAKAGWYEYVVGLARVREDANALKTGVPTTDILNRIEKQFDYTKSKDQLSKYIRKALAAFIILVMAGSAAGGYAIYQSREAVRAEERATNAQRDVEAAQKQVAEARQDIINIQEETKRVKEEAERARDEAQKSRHELTQANLKRQEAELKTRDAVFKQRNAETKAMHSLEKARLANEEAKTQTQYAKKQQGIANALELANDSSQRLEEGSVSIKEALKTAIDSGQKATENGIEIMEADTALRNSLALVPSPSFPVKEISGQNNKFALSPNSKYIAALKPDNKVEIGNMIAVKTGNWEGRMISGDSLVKNARLVALDNNAKRIATANIDEIQIYDLESKKKFPLIHITPLQTNSFENLYINGIALSPSGKYLAFIIGDRILGEEPIEFSEEVQTGKAIFWDVENNQQLAIINDGLTDITLSSIAFGAKENVLAIGGGKIGGIGNTGYSILWNLEEVISEVGRLNQAIYQTENQTNLKDVASTQKAKDNKENWKTAFDRQRIVAEHSDIANVIVPGEDVNQFIIVTDLYGLSSKQAYGFSREAEDYNSAITLWKKSLDGIYKPEIYLPRPQQIRNVGFINDYKTLAVIRENVVSNQEYELEKSNRKKFYEEWVSTGYATALNIGSDQQISFVSFDEKNLMKAILLGNSNDRLKIINASLNVDKSSSVQDDINSPQEKVIKLLADEKYAFIEDSGQIFIRNILTKERIMFPFELTEREFPNDILISDSGNVVVIQDMNLGEESGIFIYNLTEKGYSNPKPIEQFPLRMSLSNDGRILAYITSGDHDVKIIETSSGRDITSAGLSSQVIKKSINPWNLKLSSTGRYIALASQSDGKEQLFVIETKTGNIISETTTRTRLFDKFVFSKNEKYLAIGDKDGEAQILYLNRRTETSRHLSHALPVQNIVFSRDAKKIATVSYNKTRDSNLNAKSTIIVFDVETGKPTAKIQSEGFITSINFNQLGDYLATSSEIVKSDRKDLKDTYRLTVWSLKIEELISEARKRLNLISSNLP